MLRIGKRRYQCVVEGSMFCVSRLCDVNNANAMQTIENIDAGIGGTIPDQPSFIVNAR